MQRSVGDSCAPARHGGVTVTGSSGGPLDATSGRRGSPRRQVSRGSLRRMTMSPMSTSTSPHSRTTSLRTRSNPSDVPSRDEVPERPVPARILDDLAHISVPEVHAPAGEIDGQDHQPTGAEPSGDGFRSARLPAAGMCSMTLMDKTPSNTVDSGQLARGCNSTIDGPARPPRSREIPTRSSPVSGGHCPVDVRRVDRVDHVTPTGEEGGEGRDAGAHVDQPAAGREVLEDQASRDGVFPEPRGMIGKETEGTLPVEAKRQQAERIGVPIDDGREGGGPEVTRMRRGRRSKDHERRDPVLLSHRVVLGFGGHRPQGRRQRLVKVDHR